MGHFNFKIQRPIRGIKEENHYKNTLASLEEMVDDTGIEGESNLQVRSLKGRIKILEKELQRAREESFQAGYEEGKEKAMQEALRQAELLKKEIVDLKKQYDDTLEKMKLPMLDLAKKLAAAILEDELTARDEQDSILLKKLEKMLSELVEQNPIRISISPEQIDFVKSIDLVEQLNISAKKEINFIPNNNLKPGEAIIQSNDYYLDGTYAGQLDNLTEQLKNEGK